MSPAMTARLASTHFLAGIDVGSTTAKAVVVERGSTKVIWSDYQRHEARLGGLTAERPDGKVHGSAERSRQVDDFVPMRALRLPYEKGASKWN